MVCCQLKWEEEAEIITNSKLTVLLHNEMYGCIQMNSNFQKSFIKFQANVLTVQSDCDLNVIDKRAI